MKTQCSIKKKISNIHRGTIFGTKELLPYGTYENVRQTLVRLTKEGMIKRVARGLYVKPRRIKHIGEILPPTNEIVAKIAKITEEKVSIHGVEALRQLRLSTQMQMQNVYSTTGKSRIIHIGNKKIELQHISAKKLITTNNNVGTAILAMNYLGQKNTTLETLNKIAKVIPNKEFKQLLHKYEHMPLWMISLCKKYEGQAK